MGTGRRRSSKKGKLRTFGADRSSKKKAEQIKQRMIARQRATGKKKDTDRTGRKPKPGTRGEK